MTETAGGKVEETQIQRYRSTRGINYDSVPWKLWEKSKKLFWDPADIDFSQDAVDCRRCQRRSGRSSPCPPAGSWSARKP